MIFHILLESLMNTILISGLVVVMMMMIESLNVESRGGLLNGLKKSRIGQVLCGALLGSVPGCMGGFAVVSLYTHGLLSFGALVAMMIATAGDESFVMLAMIPKEAIWIFILVFGLAVVVGIIVDLIYKKPLPPHCNEQFSVHEADCCDTPHEHHDHEKEHRHGRHFTWKRALMFVGVAIFLAALAGGYLEHEHEEEAVEVATTGGINLLSEDWMNVMFAILGLIILGVLIFASDHFVEEHLWHHIIVKHLPTIFAWTFGVLAVLGIALHFLDIEDWISSNTFLMILLAAAVGIIPESGPHLVFVTLYASGIVPLPVLLASCVAQDGHAGLPLLAESKMSFALAKLINCALAILVGSVAMLFC